MCLNTPNFSEVHTLQRGACARRRGALRKCACISSSYGQTLPLPDGVRIISSCKAAMYLYALRRARAVRVDMVDSAYEIAQESPKPPQAASHVIFQASMPVADFSVGP